MSAPPVPTDVAAPLLFGVLWNWTLYGVLVVQIYVYSYNFSEDRKSLKILVYAIFLFETLQTALSGADLYYWFVSGFGNLDHLRDPYVSAFDNPIMGSIITGTVQFFFAYRVWVLSDKKAWWYCVVIVVFSAINTVSAFAGGIYSHITRKFINPQRLRIIALACGVGSSATDCLIVAAMLFYLARPRNAEIGPFSNHAVVKILRLTVETNILTATCGIIAVLMVIIFPDEIYYTCPTAILGKLYSNTLLVSLNNRISIRAAKSGRGTLPAPVTSRPFKASSSEEPSSIVNVELGDFPYPFEGRKGEKG